MPIDPDVKAITSFNLQWLYVIRSILDRFIHKSEGAFSEREENISGIGCVVLGCCRLERVALPGWFCV
jgi:hypothetical protein